MLKTTACGKVEGSDEVKTDEEQKDFISTVIESRNGNQLEKAMNKEITYETYGTDLAI